MIYIWGTPPDPRHRGYAPLDSTFFSGLLVSRVRISGSQEHPLGWGFRWPERSSGVDRAG